MATVLSIESQSRSLFAAVLAPVLGWAVDALGARGGPGPGGQELQFLPVGLVGVGIAAAMLLTGRSGAAAK